MKKPVIAIDIDDVLADSASEVIKFSNTRYGTDLSIDDYSENLMKMWGVSLEEQERRLGEFFDLEVYSTYSHKKGAQLVLEELKKSYNLIIVTSRKIRSRDTTFAWLSNRYPGIFDGGSMHYMGFFDSVNQHSAFHTKGEKIKGLGADYLIDDQLKHCISAAGLGVEALLFGNYTWNQYDGDLPTGVTRAKDWDEVERYFRNIER